MKTKSEIQKEMSDLIALGEEIRKMPNPSKQDLKNKKNAGKRMVVLKNCALYLDTNPRRDFIVEMKKEVDKRLLRLFEKKNAWLHSVEASKIKNPDNLYYREVAPDEKKEIKKLKQQLSTINYLLL